MIDKNKKYSRDELKKIWTDAAKQTLVKLSTNPGEDTKDE